MTYKDYALAAFATGMILPVVISSLAGGFILGTFIWDRFAKTVLGIHVRHWMTRHAPSKFFPEDFISDKVK